MRIRIWSITAIVGLAVLLLVFAWPTRDEASTAVPVSCLHCEIRIVPDLTLGSPQDSLGTSGMARLATGSDGRIFTVSDMAALEPPLVYSADGELVGHLGARGSGPGEFGAPIRLASAPGGPLVIYDLRVGVQVFTGLGEYLRRLTPTSPIPQPYRDPVIVDDTLLAIASRTRSPAAPRRSVALYDLRTGEHVASSGPPSELQPEAGSDRVPTVASACRGGFWTFADGLSLTHWATDGTEGRSLPLEREDVDQVADWVGVPRGEVVDRRMWHDCEDSRLWIVALLTDPSEYEEVALTPGEPFPPELLSPSYWERTHNSLILALDAETGSLSAVAAIARPIEQFLPDGRIATVLEREDGHQEIVLHRLWLEGAR